MKNRIQNKSAPSLDDVVTLIAEGEFQIDELGNETRKQTEREVWCAEIPVYSSEFYNASQMGVRGTHCLMVWTEEYEKETLVRFYGDLLTVYRTYPREDGLTELYLHKKVSQNGV